MIFQTKKIRTETLSEYLVSVREHLRLSRSEVATSCGISEKFLEYLETQALQLLPPDVYVSGYLCQLANFYGIASEPLFEQYKKERGMVGQKTKLPLKETPSVRGFISKLVVTPKLVSISAGLLFVVLTVGYLIVEVISINSAPALVVSQPKNGDVIKASFVSVSGKTDPGTILTINDQNVFVSTDGSFHVTMGVVPGQKDLTLKATNKFEKSSSRTISIIADPAQVAQSPTTSPDQTLNLELHFVEPTTVSLTVDGQQATGITATVGTTQTVTAHDKILLSTTNAAGIEAKLNNQSLGKLGREQESLIDVPFSWDQAQALVRDSTTKTQNSN